MNIEPTNIYCKIKWKYVIIWYTKIYEPLKSFQQRKNFWKNDTLETHFQHVQILITMFSFYLLSYTGVSQPFSSVSIKTYT